MLGYRRNLKGNTNMRLLKTRLAALAALAAAAALAQSGCKTSVTPATATAPAITNVTFLGQPITTNTFEQKVAAAVVVAWQVGVPLLSTNDQAQAAKDAVIAEAAINLALTDNATNWATVQSYLTKNGVGTAVVGYANAGYAVYQLLVGPYVTSELDQATWFDALLTGVVQGLEDAIGTPAG
jgi:hypothetical protein